MRKGRHLNWIIYTRQRHSEKGVMAELTEKLGKSISDYQAALKLADVGTQYNPGPWPVAKNVPRTVFDAWNEQVPAVWKIAYEEGSSTVFLYGDPLPAHARTAGWFAQTLGPELKRAVGSSAAEELEFSFGECFDIPGWGEKMPDFAVVSHGTTGSSMPCFILEVGYHSEQDMDAIVAEVCLWQRHSTTVIIGIKITDNTGVAHIRDPRIEVLVKLKGMSDLTFHLGQGSPTPCVGPHTHLIEIPATLLLSQGSRCASSPGPLRIDLFLLQCKIQRWVLERHVNM